LVRVEDICDGIGPTVDNFHVKM